MVHKRIYDRDAHHANQRRIAFWEDSSRCQKEKAFNLEMKLKAMGMDVPISLVGSLDNEGKEPKLYLATDMMEYIVAVADSMTDGAIDSSQLDTEKLKGKYMIF